jgi:hypothetical protein
MQQYFAGIKLSSQALDQLFSTTSLLHHDGREVEKPHIIITSPKNVSVVRSGRFVCALEGLGFEEF